jgi:hypothetical protein
VLLVGTFGDGLINAFDATNGSRLGQLRDPDGEPMQIDGLWALRVGNGGAVGLTNTVYFTDGIFGETHGLFGSLAAVAPGTPEGPGESQAVQSNADVVQLDAQRRVTDSSCGASTAMITQDTQSLDADSHALVRAARAFAEDTRDDRAS